MVARMHALVPIIIAAAIVGIVGITERSGDANLDEETVFPLGTIRVDDVILQVQIADTEPARKLGLKFQEPLPHDEGMIFVFESPGVYGMWMPNVKFSLDIMWFDEDGRIVDIMQDVPPCKTVVELVSCETYTPSGEATYVLEVAAGFVERNNITSNSVLSIISI